MNEKGQDKMPCVSRTECSFEGTLISFSIFLLPLPCCDSFTLTPLSHVPLSDLPFSPFPLSLSCKGMRVGETIGHWGGKEKGRRSVCVGGGVIFDRDNRGVPRCLIKVLAIQMNPEAVCVMSLWGWVFVCKA